MASEMERGRRRVKEFNEPRVRIYRIEETIEAPLTLTLRAHIQHSNSL